MNNDEPQFVARPMSRHGERSDNVLNQPNQTPVPIHTNTGLLGSIDNAINNFRLPRITLPQLSTATLNCCTCANCLSCNFGGLFSSVNNCGAGASSCLTWCTTGITSGCTGGLTASYRAVTRAWNYIRTHLPGPNMLYFIQMRIFNLFPLRMPDVQQFDAFQKFLISSSNETTVQYYSQDTIENMKLRIIIRRINTLTGKSRPTKKVKTDETAEKKLKKRLSKMFHLNKGGIEEEYMEYEATFQWQQKVFSPREIVAYHKQSEKDMRVPLQRMYKQDVDTLLNDISNDPTLSSLDPYCQKETDRVSRFELPPTDQQLEPEIKEEPKEKKKKSKKKKKKKREIEHDEDQEHNDEEPVEENQDEDIQDEDQEKEEDSEKEDPEEMERHVKETLMSSRWGANAVQDLLNQRLSTMVHNDGFYTDAVQKRIPCDSKHAFPERFPEDATERRTSTQSMYIMANFGHVHR
jgi:hypothetical protein